MKINNVCVIGGSGFVGRHVVHLLAAQGCNVRVPTRNRERAKQLILLPTVDVVEANVHNEAELAELARGVDAVINLAGVLHDARGERGFEQAHVELPRKLIAACAANGVRRYVHMSALGADANGPSKYQRTKGAAEALVRASSLDWTLFRPSVIFGRDDNFLNLFAKLLKLLPVIFLASPNARFQPVYVEDVARAFVHSLSDLAAYGKSYDLCGPKIYTLRELVALVGDSTGRRRPIIGLNDALSYLQAFAMELLPVKLMTRDNYYSMKVDNVSSQAFPFGIQPAAIEAVVPAYLGSDSPRARYRSYRDRARRRIER
ncbi:MAG: complex I NDUFA9 subunit family protein [Betaproteobacteria bacterium]|nr:complex I NDUFA9 subunit family protein [Betaproteobacteria bacterium]